MTHLLPPNLLRLFEPRPPIPYIKPYGRDLTVSKLRTLDGVAGILEELREQNALSQAEKYAKEDGTDGADGVKKEEEQAAADAKPQVKAEQAGAAATDGGSNGDDEKKPDATTATANGTGKADDDDDTEMGEVVEPELPASSSSTSKAAAAKKASGSAADKGAASDDKDRDGHDDGSFAYLDKVQIDDDGNEFTYTEAEKLRLRSIERIKRREENLKRAKESCELASSVNSAVISTVARHASSCCTSMGRLPARSAY